MKLFTAGFMLLLLMIEVNANRLYDKWFCGMPLILEDNNHLVAALVVSTTAETTAALTALALGLGSGGLDADATAVQLLVVPLGDGSISIAGINGDETETTTATSLAILQDDGIRALEFLESRAKRIISSSPGETSNKKLGHYLYKSKGRWNRKEL